MSGVIAFAVTFMAVLPGPALSQTVLQGGEGVVGGVSAIEVWQDRIYVAGWIPWICEPAGGWIGFEATTHSFIPRRTRIAGSVLTSAPDGAGGWFIGGHITGANGVDRLGVAHILANGVLSDWAPRVDGTVAAILRVGDTVFLGGRFDRVSGQLRHNFAAIDARSGELLPLTPAVNGAIFALRAADSLLFLGGDFSEVSGRPRCALAALRMADGQLSTWDAGFRCDLGLYRHVIAIESDGDRLLVAGGIYDSVGVFHGFTALERSTGRPVPGVPIVQPSVQSMTLHGGRVYLAGSPLDVDGRAAHGPIALARSDLHVLPWRVPVTTGGDSSGISQDLEFESMGASRDRLFLGVSDSWYNYVLEVDTTLGVVHARFPRQFGTFGDLVHIAVSGDTVWLGGALLGVNAQARGNLAEFNLNTGRATAWAPNLPRQVLGLARVGSRLFVSRAPELSDGGPRLLGFDFATHEELAWHPSIDGYADHLLAVGERLFAAGSFDHVNGLARRGLVELDPLTGAATEWDARLHGHAKQLAREGDVLYVCGDFDSVGAVPRHGAAAFHLPDLTLLPWAPAMYANVQALTPAPDGVVLVSWPQGSIVAVDREAGMPLAWSPISDLERLSSAVVSRYQGRFLFSSFVRPPGDFGTSYTLVSEAVGATHSEPFFAQPDVPPGACYSRDGLLVLAGDNFSRLGATPTAGMAIVQWPSTDVAAQSPRPLHILSVTPDPATDLVRFEFIRGSGDAIEIFDVTGRRVHSDASGLAAKGVATWDLRTAFGDRTRPGVHFVRLLSNGQPTASKRFIVLR